MNPYVLVLTIFIIVMIIRLKPKDQKETFANRGEGSQYWKNHKRKSKYFKKHIKVRTIKEQNSQKEKEQNFSNNFKCPEFLNNNQLVELKTCFNENNVLKHNCTPKVLSHLFNVDPDCIKISINLLRNRIKYKYDKNNFCKEFTKREYYKHHFALRFGSDNECKYQNKIDTEYNLKIKEENEKEEKLKNLITNTIQNEFLKMKEDLCRRD